MNPLPSVEFACAVLQQEESQRDLLKMSSPDVSAMYGKAISDRSISNKSIVCSVCEKRGHSHEKCWTVVGLPKWHSKYKRQVSSRSENFNTGSGKIFGNQNKRMTNNVQGLVEENAGQDVVFTTQQLEQLLKFLPSQTMNSLHHSVEESDSPFSDMAGTHLTQNDTNCNWIIDSGASDI